MTEHTGEFQPSRMPVVRGLMVGLITLADGRCFYAEVVPAPKRYLRPWPHRTSLWWYEVHGTEPSSEFPTTYAYEDGGSGGGLTLRACVRRADQAVEKFAVAAYDADSGRSVDG